MTLLITLAILVGLGMIMLLAYQISASYQNQFLAARQHNLHAQKMVGLQLAQWQQQLQLGLNPLVSSLQAGTPIDVVAQQLAGQLHQLPFASNLALLDERGNVLAVADGQSPAEMGLDYGPGLASSTPELRWLPASPNALIAVQTVQNSAQQTLATLAVRIEASTVAQLLANTSYGPEQELYLLDARLRPLAHAPAEAQLPNLASGLIARIQRAEAQTLQIQLPNEPGISLLSANQLGKLPYVLLLRIDSRHFLQQWKSTVFFYLLGSTLMLLLSLLTAYFFWRSQRLGRHLRQKEHKLSASEARFRQMIETTPVGLVLARLPDFYITYINQHAARVFGLPQAAALSKRAFELYYDRIDFIHHSDSAMNGRALNNVECLLRHKEGTPFWASVSMSVTEAHDGSTLLMGLSDITQRKRLEEELKKRATTDSLSGLANRAYFMESAGQELLRCKRMQQPAALLMLDIDFFKKINDNYGHQVGDLAIQAMASICRSQLRELDLLGRIGGEEFIAFLPATDLDTARQLAEQLRCAIATQVIALEDGREVRFTSSLGLTLMRADDLNLDAIMKRADDALYQSKHQGRNRTSEVL
ncbi:GGDEF domain-containing protein [Chitinibacter tainanensis]|uniref:GGDEF domain-containing protein n=1 Tax=Chitinibacter tainanensis TaxID=230667 RepID=UPI00235468AF|nr:diguanylate cyclase [Chitinibacter tainanensis]